MKKVFDSKTLTLNFPDSYLKNLSHIKIGSKSNYLFMPQSVSDLLKVVRFADKNKLPVCMLGGGSNLLFGNTENVVLVSEKNLPQSLNVEHDVVSVSANFNINLLMMKLADHDLGGFEFLSGIPAHIGGLTIMNAGSYGKSFGDSVIKIEFVDKEGILRTEDDLKFSYRNSSVKGFITKVWLKATAKEKSKIHREMRDVIADRKKKQPLSYPNLGCIFKNPPNDSAGRLIDNCGLKGLRFGGAEISKKHANFIINRNDAKFEDVINLIESAKKAVWDKFKISLETEIRIIGL
jgi:UDP-N-acetylmuramate dehydrogenase